MLYWEKKPCGLSLRANYADRGTAACSAKLVPTFADRGCCVVSATNSHSRILGFLNRIRYYFFQVAELYSRGWVDPVLDPLLIRKSGSTGNRTWDLWICSQELWSLDEVNLNNDLCFARCWFEIINCVHTLWMLLVSISWVNRRRMYNTTSLQTCRMATHRQDAGMWYSCTFLFCFNETGLVSMAFEYLKLVQ
jgi:hypothetical protein